jgi:hypothetical protein
LKTPEELERHTHNYKDNAWMDYTFEELGWWTRLLQKRATHRTNPEKAAKDLYDANNYHAMHMEKIRTMLKGEPYGA